MSYRKWFGLAACVALVGVVACQDSQQVPTEPDTADFAKNPDAILKSNGAPSGPHYTLNIIGVDKDKTAAMDGNNGHRIFVKLWGGDSKILLQEGDFAVLDANGTDNDGAAFQLPNPDPNCDGVTDYSVYVRALGKPGGSADMQTCYTDDTGSWCAVDYEGGVSQITIGPRKGKSQFRNESKNLLYVDYCTEWVDADASGDFTADECVDWTIIPLFGEDLSEYYWDYDNYGLRLAQLRFYYAPTEAWTNEQVECSSEI